MVNVYLADLGFCTEQKTTTELLGEELVCGTIGYFAPEVLKTGSYSNKSDIFGVGCILYFLITGKQLIRGYNQREQMINNIECILPDHFYMEL